MAISNPGNLLNSTPSHGQQALATNYLDFTNGTSDWAQQYLPDLMAQEAEVFGPRTISGFLSQVGAEEAMQSDQVIWSEQGRLHLSYTGTINDVTATNGAEITISAYIDGRALNAAGHGIRVNDMVIVSGPVNGVVKCLVGAVGATTIDVSPYNNGAAALSTDAGESRVLVFGSEFGKGDSYRSSTGTQVDTKGANEPDFHTFQQQTNHHERLLRRFQDLTFLKLVGLKLLAKKDKTVTSGT
jgi:hypothetical protein